MLEPGFLLSLGLAAVGGLVWAVRIEGRINVHERLFTERDNQATERHQDVQARLIRIEAKLDKDREGK